MGDKMLKISMAMRHMIKISDEELEGFLTNATIRSYKKNDLLSKENKIPDEIYFINSGILRVMVADINGVEHTIHFALENQFIADYSNFIQGLPSIYNLQALEDLEVVVLPRSTIEWGYQNLVEGQKMGRLIAEYYFIYQDDRIKNNYIRSPKERYDAISEIFPNIHNRVPQHMIASYLGITPVHLSRLKRERKA